MAASTAAATVERAAERHAVRRAPARRVRTRSHVPGGVLWIAVVAVLLAGVVAMNVAVLRLNVSYDKLGQQKVDLVAKNASLSSRLSSAAAAGRIEQLARTRLGLAPATPDKTTYITLGR
jgi:cell division protein FtsL